MGKEIEKEAEEWAEGRFDYRDYKDARFKLDHPIEGYVRGYLAARLKYEVKIAEAYLAGFEGAKRTAQPRWISVKERLPEEQGEYLVYSKTYRTRTGMVLETGRIGVFCFAKAGKYDTADFRNLLDEGFYYESIYYPPEEATHWMNLPAAPEEE